MVHRLAAWSSSSRARRLLAFAVAAALVIASDAGYLVGSLREFGRLPLSFVAARSASSGSPS